MGFTDEELDRDWKPNGRRPQSTLAKSFSAELMDIFRIENSLTDLDESVTEKKQKVDRTTKELASLEARLREMEERLRRSQGGSRAPLPSFQPQQQDQRDQQHHHQDLQHSTPQKRPGTARATHQAPSSGNMPPTPGASEGEYYIITRADLHDGAR